MATHVVTVTIGYSATFLAGFLAIIYIVRGFFTASLDRARPTRFRAWCMASSASATLFSFVGTVLGGIWADQSWGRFWGWDRRKTARS
ncbi:MAG: cytochrome c biogenesis protein CcsA [Opitutus sp.]|nr:cytochrome c biogenesis protein CcsA [Opitutus sp.]